MNKKEKYPWMKGIQTILTTPLHQDQSVDLEGLKKNVDFGAKSKVHALIALGTQGEFYAFDTQERKDIIKATVEANKGRKPVIAGTSDSGTLPALHMTKYAKEVGADAVIVTPPYYSAVTLNDVYRHFEVLNEVGIPMVVYNAPARQGYNLTPDFLQKLCDLENMVAIKQATQNIVEHEKTLALIGDSVAVFGGSEAFIYPILTLGCVGSSTTAATCFPQIFVDIYDAVEAGNFEQAKKLYDSLEPFRRICEKLGHAAVVKYASEKIGLAGGPMRLPLPTPSKEQLKAVDPILTQCGLL
ncbi:dihydrodipicolinate synthase family protein [Candidatus Formimonas warabiya]|uniref:4-hydroxy-tetrahydrodipicolinate synthase n=1 Tax=Formimonas warabiya TaxID=1761012 RepID=A0A3G1KYS8_FORW1|nr:dihydrodipicolinate synthase family protein [Candidatus Formimonas warabiya]ATW27612.1 hypothetical protein DCMF_25210 [Candidatus Formimonas warabiya]